MNFSVLFSARASLWVMVFTGFALNYMIRININIAIVDMVHTRTAVTEGTTLAECMLNNTLNRTSVSPVSTTLMMRNVTELPPKKTHQGGSSTKFDWDEREQNLILGAFFWSMWILQLAGGVLAQRYGTKLVFGLSQLVSALLAFLVPVCGSWGFHGIFAIRFLQGLVNGLTWPAMHVLIGKWVPPEERSKFVSAYMGSSLGAAVVFPVCGLLIAWHGWEAVFHATGICGVIWFIGWWLLVFDTPQQHPRISERERTYIERSLKAVSHDEKLPTPWRALLTSVPVWLATLTQFGYIWGLFTLMTQAPTYFKFIHGFNIRMTGVLSGIPHLTRTVFSLLFSVLADCMLDKRIMSTTRVRKFAVLVGSIISGLCMIALGYMGCNSTGAVIMLTAATAIGGAMSSGSLATTVDLSPNFAGAVFGLVSSFSVFPGFLSPILVGYLTFDNQTTSQWQLVFVISAVIQMVTAALFMAFGTSETQHWNSPVTTKESDGNLKDMKERSQ